MINQHLLYFSEYLRNSALKGIADFKGDQLKHAETVEKNSMPTKDGQSI